MLDNLLCIFILRKKEMNRYGWEYTPEKSYIEDFLFRFQELGSQIKSFIELLKCKLKDEIFHD